MHMKNSRRDFLKTSFAVSAATLGLASLSPLSAEAMEPIKRKGGPRLRRSLAAYSFRDSFNAKDPAKRITLFDFIDYCADQGLEGAELTSYYFPKDASTEFLLQLRQHAFLRGVNVSGSSVGNNFVVPKGPKRDQQIADTKKWVDACAVFGAPHIRVFAGPVDKSIDMAASKKLVIEAFEECADYAGKQGIFLGLENHHGVVSEPEDLLEIVRAVKSPWFGINLDTGNFYTDDPYADLAKCAPYAVNVQVKVDIKRRNDKETSRADFARLIKILREANYQGWVALEYEAKEDPWTGVPKYLEQLRKVISEG